VSSFTVVLSRLSPLVEALAPEAPVGAWAPPVDVRETATDLVIEVELPGTAAADIRVTCHEDAVLVEGVKGESVRPGMPAADRFLRVERAAGPFRRVVPLPTAVDRDRGHACVRDGVLAIAFPKARP
jgi:HSP20 family protein